MLGAGLVQQAICEMGGSGRLKEIVELRVRLRTDGRLEATPRTRARRAGSASDYVPARG